MNCAELAPIPVAQLGAVEADLARRRLQAANEHARQRRLARAGRPDDGERFARLQLEADAVEHRLLAARRHEQEALDGEAALAAAAGATRRFSRLQFSTAATTRP